MRSLLSVVQGLGIGLVAIGLLSLIFGGWMLLAAVMLGVGVVLTVASYVGVDQWKRAGTDRTDRMLAAATELMVARVYRSYPIVVRRPRRWARLLVTVMPPNDEPYRTTLSQLLEPGEALPGNGRVIVVARGERELPDVRWVRAPDAGWQGIAADPSVSGRIPAWGSVRTRTSRDSRRSFEERQRSWQTALVVGVGGVTFAAAAVLLGVLQRG